MDETVVERVCKSEYWKMLLSSKAMTEMKTFKTSYMKKIGKSQRKRKFTNKAFDYAEEDLTAIFTATNQQEEEEKVAQTVTPAPSLPPVAEATPAKMTITQMIKQESPAAVEEEKETVTSTATTSDAMAIDEPVSIKPSLIGSPERPPAARSPSPVHSGAAVQEPNVELLSSPAATSSSSTKGRVVSKYPRRVLIRIPIIKTNTDTQYCKPVTVVMSPISSPYTNKQQAMTSF